MPPPEERNHATLRVRSPKLGRPSEDVCTELEHGRLRVAGVCSRHVVSRVLIADDSAVARVTVARRVRAAGFEVVEHDSVASAATVDARTITCALLDFDLGDGFGVDVAARLRSEESGLPIAFFTSSSTSDVAGAHVGIRPGLHQAGRARRRRRLGRASRPQMSVRVRIDWPLAVRART